MKKFIVFTSLVLLIGGMTSCVKEVSNPDLPAISAAIDGKTSNFGDSLNAWNVSTGNLQQLLIAGFSGNPYNDYAYCEMSILSDKKITVGTYKYDTLSANPMRFLYHERKSGIGTDYSYMAGEADPMIVTITQIDSKSIKGNFAGTLHTKAPNGSVLKKVITNGQFYLLF